LRAHPDSAKLAAVLARVEILGIRRSPLLLAAAACAA
jgi:hypothetical protein